MAKESAEEQKAKLRLIEEQSQKGFSQTHEVREQALRVSREIIRNSANSIRATHRGEFDLAREILSTVTSLTQQIEESQKTHPAVYYAGYVEDALKEYVEANATLALVEGSHASGQAFFVDDGGPHTWEELGAALGAPAGRRVRVTGWAASCLVPAGCSQ